MAIKSVKPISFDAAAKFFMQKYDIPTKKDINKLLIKIDKLEKLIKQTSIATTKPPKRLENMANKNKNMGKSNTQTASDQVHEIVRNAKEGIDFTEIKSKTGYADKKLRNIIFRLNKIGKIKRKHRGIYIST